VEHCTGWRSIEKASTVEEVVDICSVLVGKGCSLRMSYSEKSFVCHESIESLSVLTAKGMIIDI
jgi:hypothetical protein